MWKKRREEMCIELADITAESTGGEANLYRGQINLWCARNKSDE